MLNSNKNLFIYILYFIVVGRVLSKREFGKSSWSCVSIPSNVRCDDISFCVSASRTSWSVRH